MKSIIFATRNEHKIKEVNEILAEYAAAPTQRIRIKGLQDVNCFEELPETKDTIEGNSEQKARYVYDNYRVDCFAEDTGLFIDALGGKPGVHTAHYAGPERDATENMKLVLQELKGVKNRSARFKTTIALILGGPCYLFEGVVEGNILHQQNGVDGFGYDPIFAPTTSHLSFAQMPASEKNKISHRFRALIKMIDFLQSSKI